MNEKTLRLPPHSLEAEQSVIGAMILDQDAIFVAEEFLVEDDFYHPDLRIIFAAIITLNRNKKPVDVIILQDYLQSQDQLKKVGGIDMVTKLVLNITSTAHINEYVKIVKEKSILRQLIDAGQDIIRESYQNKEELEYILNHAEEQIFNIIQGRRTDEFSSIKELTHKALDKIAEAHNNPGLVTGIASGFTDLDIKTAGLQPSDLILIAARPSMGKSALALNIAQHVAIKEHQSVGIFSLEMSKEQLASRLLCSEAMVDAQKIRTGKLEDTDWEKLMAGAAVLADTKIFIDDTPSISLSELRAKCRKLKLEKGLDVIMIDYLQLMTGNSKTESRQQEISEISRGLKAVAREMQAPVIALSQLSRAVEQRANHRPMLSDLRESGAIEQDADVVMFLYRDEYYNPETELKGIAELIVAKQRNGPTGTIELIWSGEHTRFMNYEKM